MAQWLADGEDGYQPGARLVARGAAMGHAPPHRAQSIAQAAGYVKGITGRWARLATGQPSDAQAAESGYAGDMEANKSLGFVFADPDWLVKVLLGGVISAIPAVNLASAGYLVATVRNVAAGKERPLPDWSAFGEYVVSGLLLFVAVLLYCLPLGLLNNINSMLNGFVGIDYIGYAISGLITTLSCLQSLYALLLGLWLPAVIARFAATGEFSAFFRFREIWGLISRNASDYAVAIVVSVVAGIIATLAGLALCVIGVIFTGFVAAMVLAHLLGQILRRDTRSLPAT